MIKHLSRHGNSMALVIDRPVLEILKISADTPLELTTDGESLVITPVRDPQRAVRLQAALESTNRRYGRALQRLAE